MRARSLKFLLTQEWMLFAGTIAELFAGTALLLLVSVEDRLIDSRLTAVADSLTLATLTLTRVLSEITVFQLDEVPLDVHARPPFATPGKPSEMWRANRRYVRVLVTQGDGQSEGQIAILYDVTDPWKKRIT